MPYSAPPPRPMTPKEDFFDAIAKGKLERISALAGVSVDARAALLDHPNALSHLGKRHALENNTGLVVEKLIALTQIPADSAPVKDLHDALTNRSNGRWPLEIADYLPNWGETLVRAGIATTCDDNGKNLLHRLLMPYRDGKNVFLVDREVNNFIALCNTMPDLVAQLLNQPDNNNETCVHAVAYIYDVQQPLLNLIIWMRDNGADFSRKNIFGKTPVDIARESELHKLADAIAQLTARDGWIIDGENAVSRIQVLNSSGYRLTDVFNFQNRERVSITQNLQTTHEIRETTPFSEILNAKLLEDAYNAYIAAGGKIPRDCIEPGMNLRKVRTLSIEKN